MKPLAKVQDNTERHNGKLDIKWPLRGTHDQTVVKEHKLDLLAQSTRHQDRRRLTQDPSHLYQPPTTSSATFPPMSTKILT
jgi:hypothetical protein